MSKTIEMSDQDYACIQKAAAADGISLDAWVVAKLPLDVHGADPVAPAFTHPKPGRTMADRFAGRLGVVASEGDGRFSENTGEKFTDHLEEKRRAGIL